MKKFGRMSLSVSITPDELIYIAEKLKDRKKQVEEEGSFHDVVSETITGDDLILSFCWELKTK